MIRVFLAATVGVLLIVGIAFWFAPGAAIAASCKGRIVTASWFGKETCKGRPPGRGKHDCKTADGTPFDGSQFLVAHKDYPLGTKVRISFEGKSIVTRVRDRGPYIRGREVDLSRVVAERLGFTGVQKVCLERLR